MPETRHSLPRIACLQRSVVIALVACCVVPHSVAVEADAQETVGFELDDTSRRRPDVELVEPVESLKPDEEDATEEDATQQDDTEDDDVSLIGNRSEEDAESDETDDASESKPVQRHSELGSIQTSTRGLKINIAETQAETPADQSYRLDQQAGALPSVMPSEKRFAWAAPNIRYQPLYFEDVPLERYGQTPGGLRQTILSGAHFYKSAILLPYQAVTQPQQECDWPLGFCRPGSEAPFVWERHLRNQ